MMANTSQVGNLRTGKVIKPEPDGGTHRTTEFSHGIAKGDEHTFSPLGKLYRSKKIYPSQEYSLIVIKHTILFLNN